MFTKCLNKLGMCAKYVTKMPTFWFIFPNMFTKIPLWIIFPYVFHMFSYDSQPISPGFGDFDGDLTSCGWSALLHSTYVPREFTVT